MAVLAASVALAACLSTKVESLGPNMVRLNLIEAEGPADESVIRNLLVLAAKETVARGYTLFRLTDWRAGPARPIVANEPAGPNFSVTVVMYRDGEQGLTVVFDTRHILKPDDEIKQPEPKKD
ncbi:hypothetical protein [Methylocystis sp. ATCC 49242]|uniref:hypothetical protein n=1 Tax=Methylocystis sp. ATCC 49242 TaxID=622637 RepID=UPI0001F8846E|nr:hypothetical protein [Methylocystis sp. ATCC 49242]